MANIDAMKILGSILSSGALSRGSGSNVLGSVIGAMTGGGGQSGGGALGSLVGSMLGGGQSGGGGVGGLLGGLLGGGSSNAGQSGGGLGDLLGMAMKQFGSAGQGGSSQAAREAMPSGMDYNQAEQQAEVLIRSMVNAAKSDGQVDQEEQQKIVGQLGDVTQEEVAFVQAELAKPLDVNGFVSSVPRGMEQQVYAMSLMAIDLDSKSEAQYLHQLAQGMGLQPDVCNQIHEQMGAPKLYS